MLSKLAVTTLRSMSTRCGPAAPIIAKAATARLATTRFFSKETPFAVDAPDGDHDLQDLEESSSWAKRAVDVASVTEDADAITQMHDAVLETKVFAVDAPDGEHDLEDVEEHLAGVNRIIETASVLENADEIEKQHRHEEESRKQAMELEFKNPKY